VKIIYRYLLKNFIGPFILTFFLAIFILLMQFLWKYVDDVVGKGLEIHVILEFIFYASASFVSMAMPLAVLLASLMTFGNLGERYELVAMKASGIPLVKIMLPIAVFSLFIGVFTFWFANNIAPIASAKASCRYYDIKTLKQAFKIDEGVFYDGLPNYIIRIGSKDKNQENVKDVLIYDHSRRQGNTTITYARRGTMQMTPDDKFFLLTLYEGYYWDESIADNEQYGKHALTRAHFKKQYKKFDLSTFEFQRTSDASFFTERLLPTVKQLSKRIDTIQIEMNSMKKELTSDYMESLQFYSRFIYKDSTSKLGKIDYKYAFSSLSGQKKQEVLNYACQYSEIGSASLFYQHERIQEQYSNLKRNQIELHRKFTLALSCFLFFFIGAPLGAIIRKGGIGIPLVITVFFFTLHFALSLIGENIAKGSDISVAFGMWLSTAVLLPICIFLTYKATVDSAVLSIETYEKWFKKIFVSKRQ
jgi:lipopolysaccharide export system permease protein